MRASKQLFKIIAGKLIRPVIERHISKPSNYTYQGIRITVLPGVFHPRFFFSTRLLLRQLRDMDLEGRSFLELGAGAGLISIFAARKGANVIASDISSISIQNIRINQKQNDVEIRIIHSDLFEKIPTQKFEFVIINPPYYKKNPLTEADHAWYCGENGEYFSRLFSQIADFADHSSYIMMVLSDDCDLPMIKSTAGKSGLKLDLVAKYRLLIEDNFIFRVLAV